MGRATSKVVVFCWVLVCLLGGAARAYGLDEALANAEAGPESNDAFSLNVRHTGDFDKMVEQRVVRVLVSYNKTNYFLDGADQKGITHDFLKEWEKSLNKQLKLGRRKLNVAFMPISRDQLIPALLDGRGDLAASNLTITPARQKLVDFTVPLATNVKGIVVTAPGVPAPETIEGLSGREVWVRKSSSYYDSLLKLSERLEKAGQAPVGIRKADEHLETEDLLEMVNAGLVPMIIADDYLAEFWAQVLPKIKLHPELAVRTGGELGWMMRPGSPKLRKMLDPFIRKNRKGTLLGNMLLKRYLRSTNFVKNAVSKKDRARFNAMVALFKKYADQYGFDWLMMAAQAYQESGLDQAVRSPVGAIGVMQVMPATGKDMGILDLEKLEPNIHAGIKYMRWIDDRYFKDPGIDKVNQALFAFAGYNAGPNRIARLRKKAAEQGLDPNQWFDNVEHVVARQVGREPVQYVANIYKYYLAYRLIQEREQARSAGRGKAAGKR